MKSGDDLNARIWQTNASLFLCSEDAKSRGEMQVTMKRNN